MRTKPKINVVIFGKFFGFGNWVDGIWLLYAVMYAVVSCVNHVWQVWETPCSGGKEWEVHYERWLLYGYYFIFGYF